MDFYHPTKALFVSKHHRDCSHNSARQGLFRGPYNLKKIRCEMCSNVKLEDWRVF